MRICAPTDMIDTAAHRSPSPGYAVGLLGIPVQQADDTRSRATMDTALTISDDARHIAGILLITIVAVEWGGSVVLRMVRGRVPATQFQIRFARAGHAHAAVLVVLALVCQLWVDTAELDGFFAGLARLGVPIAAVLFPLGFFLSSAGRDRNQPNRLIVLLWVGAAVLAAGVTTLGVGLLRA
jgi:hypothetical protein